MLRNILLFVASVFFSHSLFASECPETLDFSFRTLAGKDEARLCDAYAGKVLLVVNTASYCGFTPQYENLKTLYDRYRDRGFAVLGFPTNDFSQEPGNEQEIQSFCRLTYGVDFPMFQKIQVKESTSAHPFYQTLAAAAGGYPEWNFHKYLLDRSGQVIGSFPSPVRPTDPQIVEAIEKLL